MAPILITLVRKKVASHECGTHPDYAREKKGALQQVMNEEMIKLCIELTCNMLHQIYLLLNIILSATV